MDAFHAPAAFLFYPTDFVADTTDFSAEEVGIYMRLLCRQWTAGSLPSDIASLARIGGVSKARMTSAWNMLGRCFRAHPVATGQIVQGRLERVRAAALEYHRKRVESGKAGAKNRYSPTTKSLEQKTSRPTVLLEQNNSEPTEKNIADLQQSHSYPYPDTCTSTNLASLDSPPLPPRIDEFRRMVKPDLPDVPADAFGSLEADVARFVALAAAENQTGKISLGRIQSLRRALLAARDEFPHAFAAALCEANQRGKPSVNYLRAIAKNHEAPQPSAPKTDDDSLPDYLIAAVQLHKRDFGVGGAA